MEFVITDTFTVLCSKLQMMSEDKKKTLARLSVVCFAQRNTIELITLWLYISYGSYWIWSYKSLPSRSLISFFQSFSHHIVNERFLERVILSSWRYRFQKINEREGKEPGNTISIESPNKVTFSTDDDVRHAASQITTLDKW